MLYALIILDVIIGIFLLVGLIKPKVAFWMKKPTRLKIVVISIIGMIVVGMLINLTTDSSEISVERVNLAKEHIEEGQYSSAISILENINESDSLYTVAVVLIHKADSLSKISKFEITSNVKKESDTPPHIKSPPPVKSFPPKNEEKLAFKMFNSIDDVIEDIGEYDAETYKIISEAPLHIQISPMVIPNDFEETKKIVAIQDLIMVSFYVIAHSDINEITVTSVPTEYDVVEKKYLGLIEEYSITKTLTRQAGLEYLRSELSISSYNELFGAKYGDVICGKCLSDKFNKLIYEDEPPSHSKTLLIFK